MKRKIIPMRLMIQVDADINLRLSPLKFPRVQLTLLLEMKKNLNGQSLNQDQFLYAIKLFQILEIIEVEYILHQFAKMVNKMLTMQ